MIATGKCDTTKLANYRDYDYVVDDDIVKKEDFDYVCYYPLHSDYKDIVSGRDLSPIASSDVQINKFENNQYLHLKGKNCTLKIGGFIPAGLMIFNQNKWTIQYYMQCLGSDNMINFLSNNPSDTALNYASTVPAGYFCIAVIGRAGWHNYFNYNGKRAIGNSDYSPISMGDKLMHRITITFDNGYVNIYKDGNKANVSNNPFTKLDLINISDWKLWSVGNYLSETYIHDIKIWNRVLSETEVVNIT